MLPRVMLLCLLCFVLDVGDGLSVVGYNEKICVIGAGFSGLASARYLKEYGADFKVLEASRHIGGTWRFDPHVGVDEDGIPVFTSMYKDLRTNTPRQTMEYYEFPFPADTPSYPAGPCYYKYLKTFATEFDLLKHIQFQSLVTQVKWADPGWNVTYMKTDSKTNQTDFCSFVIVSTGEYANPVIPKFEGLENFKGKVLHSHDYKEPEPFRGTRLLVVGAGPSGLDMILHLVDVTAKFVHSHHLVYNQPDFGPNYVKKPDIREFTSNGVVFEDGSFEEIDTVLLCTGYEMDHSFLDNNVGVTATSKYVLPLYQHVLNILHPSMAFVGLSKKVINKVMDAQAHYVAALAMKKFELPPRQAMLQSWLDHAHTLRRLVDVNVIGDKMDQYFGNLTAEAGIPLVPPVITAIRNYNGKFRLDDWINYRDFDFSIIDDNNFEKRYNPRNGTQCPFSDLE